jgi:hypothetical protein
MALAFGSLQHTLKYSIDLSARVTMGNDKIICYCIVDFSEIKAYDFLTLLF